MQAISRIAAGALIAGSVAVSAATAGTIELDAPMTGATLHTRNVALSVYFVDAADGFEVVGTCAAERETDQPSRFIMTLADGDRVRFGLPGHPGVLYEFVRRGHILTVSDEIVQPRGS